MTAPETPETRPNSNPSEEFLGKVREVMRKLERGERIELSDVGVLERMKAEELMKKEKQNFNIAVRIGEKIRVRSGGYEIQLKKNNKIAVYGRDGHLINLYENECLAKNMTTLLMGVLAKYGLGISERWITVSLPRQDRDVRKLQSWILALITNFSVKMHDNPMIC
jgi:hypothetical protein